MPSMVYVYKGILMVGVCKDTHTKVYNEHKGIQCNGIDLYIPRIVSLIRTDVFTKDCITDQNRCIIYKHWSG